MNALRTLGVLAGIVALCIVCGMVASWSFWATLGVWWWVL